MAGLRRRAAPPQPLPLDFSMDGRWMQVPDHPGRWWLRALAAEKPHCWMLVVPLGLGAEDRAWVLERLYDPADALDLDDVERAAEQVVGAITGIDLWAAHRLARMAYGNWLDFDSWCAGKGIDPLASGPGRLATSVYAWRLAGCEKRRDVTKLDGDVFAAPPMRTASGQWRDQAPAGWSDETEEASFLSAMQTLGKTPPQ